jgi:hypothetical protein
VRVWESGASEGHLVIRWIGVEPQLWATLLPAKAGRLPHGLSSRDSCRLRRDRSSFDIEVAIATGASLSYGLKWCSIKSGRQFTVTCVVGKRNVKAVNDVCSRRVTDKGRS